MDIDDGVDYIRSKNFLLFDCESIRIGTHDCIRKIYGLAKDGFSSVSHDFHPCVEYDELSWIDLRSFEHCKRHVHKLEFYPPTYAYRCIEVKYILRDFIQQNRINLLLYKGGNIEKSLAEDLNIPSFNIENVGAPKVGSHEPEVEVDKHWNFLLRRGCILQF